MVQLIFPLVTSVLLAQRHPYKHSFWGTVQSEESIKYHVAEAVFGQTPRKEHLQKVHVYNAEPPLVCIDDFIDPKWCDVVVNAASNEGMIRSTTTMGSGDKEVSDSRTSSQTWLKESESTSEELRYILRLIAHRTACLSGQPPSHMENLQVVHYRENQYFNLHTDHMDDFNSLPCKGRLATCLMYLNNSKQYEYENLEGSCSCSGGETYFPEFDTAISPKKGRAIFWWNTIERPGMSHYSPEMYLNPDMKMRHAGMSIVSGEKWICNRWVHPIKIVPSQEGVGVRGLVNEDSFISS